MRRLIVGAFTLTMLAAACGGGDDAPDVASLNGGRAGADGARQTSTGDIESALLEFSKCMREEGIDDFPDLTLSGNPFTQVADAGIDANSDSVQAALETCQPLIEDVVALDDLDPQVEADLRDRILRLVQCMRDRDHDLPDPDFSGGIGPKLLEQYSAIDTAAPGFAQDLRACFAEVGMPGLGGDAGTTTTSQG